MRARSAVAALAFAFTASAASPMRLEAQRQLPSGIIRPSYSDAPPNCFATKVVMVIGSTAAGVMLMIVPLMLVSFSMGFENPDAEPVKRGIMKAGAAIGFFVGVSFALSTRCPRRRASSASR